ncbi:methyltransferase [Pseudodesulfovibrio indicus]|uniref:methyltransferase n=1 Tax=Pseudodesulfovibrio indicus TaxID=1716143 RepID=UPI00292CB5D7|nr:methyltransferase [Pseudodesulfovibrio indicus]
MLFPEPSVDFMPVNNMITEAVAPKALMAAVDLKLFDRLSGRSVDSAALAAEAGLVSERLEPVLDILAALGLLYGEGGCYTNTPLAEEFLVSGSPLYQGDYLAVTAGFYSSIERSIGDLLAGAEVDREGTDRGWSAERIMDGTAQNARWSGAGAVAGVAASLPGFASFRTMCDIGGNHGLYTMGILDRNPALCGTIFDLPSVAEQAAGRFERFGYGDRAAAVGMDFRKDSLPEAGFDLAVASHVLYAFRDDLPGALRKIADGLKPGGWFISHHYSGNQAPESALCEACLEMVTRLSGYPSHFIGREELASALTRAGFEEPEFHDVPGRGMNLIAAARKG